MISLARLLAFAAAVAVPSTAAASAVTPIFSGDGSGIDTTAVQEFALGEAPLEDALAEFGRQAGVRVVLDGPISKDIRTRGVSGRLAVADALRRLIEGTGVAARFIDGETLIVKTRGPGAYRLREVLVTGAATRAKGYAPRRSSSSTRTDSPLLNTPQSVTVVTSELIADQAMQSVADVVRYIPGITMGLGEGHRDQPTIRGMNTTADFYVDGARDDAQYYRDLYNVDRVEALKGPNAMTFGRGGGGGVVNRVLKQAQWAPTHALVLTGGAYEQRRASLDLGQGWGNRVAARLNAVTEQSGGFRDEARLTRRGVNPTAALALGARTTLRLSYEDFVDDRRVDRGIPSFNGAPSAAPLETFFGNPGLNDSRAEVRLAGVVVEHVSPRGFSVRSRLQLGDYDKFYQNTYPTGVNAAGTDATLAAYNSLMLRRNAFSQIDIVGTTRTGAIGHTILFGTEAGRQRTNALRKTGYFDNTSTSLTVPFASPTVSTPVTFRPSAGDADGRSIVTTTAIYVQDQLQMGDRWNAVLGLRRDRFAIRFHSNRDGQDLERTDNFVAPRVGLVFKPVSNASLYASYALSYLPSAGDQFTALSPTTRTLEPERFVNREVGVKWEPARDLTLTAAAYRLDHTNAAAPHPTEPGRLVQTGRERTRGFELGVLGRITDLWEIAGGFARQRGEIVSATTASAAGATLPLVPERSFSLWNKYSLTSFLGLGVGVTRQSEMFAAVDNKVRLPAFMRVDAAAFTTIARAIRAQINVENLFDRRYYPTSHGNNNIIPGAPRTVRLSVVTAF